MLKCTALIFLVSMMFSSFAQAGVVFLPNAGGSVGSSSQVDSSSKCEESGYTHTTKNCPDGILYEECPYDSGYFKYCFEDDVD